MKVIASVALLAALTVNACRDLDRSSHDLRIVTATVTKGDIVDTVSVTGRLEPIDTVTIGAQASGRVAEIDVDYNSIVHRGDVLARLDPSTEQTRVDESQAGLRRAANDVERLKVALADAQKRYRRVQALRDRRLAPQADLDTAAVSLKLAEAQLRAGQAAERQARATLDQRLVDRARTVITAPMDGVIVSRSIEVGQTIAARVQAPVLFTLAARLTAMQALARVTQADIAKVHPGQPVRFRVDAYPNEEFAGTVSQVRLSPTLVRNVVTYPTVIDVPNAQRKLRPGMTANVAIQVATRRNVVRVPEVATRFSPSIETLDVIGSVADRDASGTSDSRQPPADAVSTEGNDGDMSTPTIASDRAREDEVWVMRDGELLPVDVELGIEDGEHVELVEGDLQPGDEVVSNVLDPNARVRPAPRWSDFFRQPGNRRRR